VIKYAASWLWSINKRGVVNPAHKEREMKKLIAVLALAALISGAAFAQISVSGHVIGSAILAQGDGGDVTMGGGMNRLRLEASGATDDGVFGGWLRIEGAEPEIQGYAFWRPISQLTLRIGKFSDCFWGKDGHGRWMFYQTASDTSIVNVGNAWGGGYSGWPNVMSRSFYGGFEEGLMLEIRPVEFIGINIGIPVFVGAEIVDSLLATHFQVDLNLDFGNIAITAAGFDYAAGAELHAYFALTAVDNLDLAVGFGMQVATDTDTFTPAIGLAMKLGLGDMFALKFRTQVYLRSGDPMMLFDVLPIISISNNLTAFVSAGLTIDSIENSMIDFHVNPYIQIGSEWGPSFWAGVRLWSTGGFDTIHWAIPLAIGFAF